MAHVALGVTGGIGAYKAVEVARGLQKRGHDVTAIMTRHARRFVGPLTFEAITRRRVLTDQFAPGMNADIEHIALASTIDLLLVAPATASVLAKFAHGLADDFLTSLHLATRAPVLAAPAMNTNMLEHEAVRENIQRLLSRGVHFVEPGEGFLACGWMGKGRLAEPNEIVEAAERILHRDHRFAGRRLLVTAGPTYEDLDPVRFIGNRSSGRMGMAIASEAARSGASVVLVLGPTTLAAPSGVKTIRVRSAAEMHAAVMNEVSGVDAVIMAAAVADYTPAAGAQPQKIAKQPGGVDLPLERTKDILADLGAMRAGGSRPVLVGFAAETDDVLAKARAKRATKGVDLIVANDVSRSDAGFEVETNAATLVSAEREDVLQLQTKSELARKILHRLSELLLTTTSVPQAVR